MRLFVAADLPAGVRTELEAHGRELAEAGGWRALPEAGLHATLVFLGEQDAERVAPIAAAMEGVARTVGEVALGRLLSLPPRRPRVAAVEVEDFGGGLTALQAAAVEALVALGVHEAEGRRFLAHVTVARRASGPPGSVAAPAWQSGRFAIPRLTLYESQLSPRGARYAARASFPL